MIHCDHPWSAAFTRALINKIVQTIAQGQIGIMNIVLGDLLTCLPYFPFSSALTDEIVQTLQAADTKNTIYGSDEFFRVLRFRKSLYEEFAR
jgi:hypothetical protein